MTTSERIRQLRLELRLSQKAFGERIGRKGSYISDIERGIYPAQPGMLKRISDEFGVPVSWLKGDEK